MANSVLDRPIARVSALGIAAGAFGLLLAIHWDDLTGSGTASDPQVAACVEQRTSELDTLLERGQINEGQAEDMRARALQFCRGQVNGKGPDQDSPDNVRLPE